MTQQHPHHVDEHLPDVIGMKHLLLRQSAAGPILEDSREQWTVELIPEPGRSGRAYEDAAESMAGVLGTPHGHGTAERRLRRSVGAKTDPRLQGRFGRQGHHDSRRG